MSGAQPNYLVHIDDQEYSLKREPPPTSAVVLAQREELDSSLGLETLVKDLAKVGGFIQMAYNATAASSLSDETHQLKMQIMGLGFEIVDLCSESAVTVNSFKSTTKTITRELLGMYQMLLEGFEDMAVISMSQISTHAKKMANAASKLEKGFKEEEAKVKVALENCMNTEHMEESEREKMDLRQKVLDSLIESQEKIIEAITEDEEAARKERLECERKEDDEIDKIKESPLEMVQMIMMSDAVISAGIVAGGPLTAASVITVKAMSSSGAPSDGATAEFGRHREDARERASMYKKKVEEKLELQMKFRKERRASIAQKDEFLREMMAMKDRHSNNTAAIHFLHQACGNLRELALTMHRAALFWQQLQEYCQGLSEDGVSRLIDEGSQLSSERRLEFWTSDAFKSKAIRYYAKWVALHTMCHEYMGHIKVTEGDLNEYMKYNPTREEARAQFPSLIKKNRAILKAEDRSLTHSDEVDKKIIEKLKSIPEETEDSEIPEDSGDMDLGDHSED